MKRLVRLVKERIAWILIFTMLMNTTSPAFAAVDVGISPVIASSYVSDTQSESDADRKVSLASDSEVEEWDDEEETATDSDWDEFEDMELINDLESEDSEAEESELDESELDMDLATESNLEDLDEFGMLYCEYESGNLIDGIPELEGFDSVLDEIGVSFYGSGNDDVKYYGELLDEKVLPYYQLFVDYYTGVVDEGLDVAKTIEQTGLQSFENLSEEELDALILEANNEFAFLMNQARYAFLYDYPELFWDMKLSHGIYGSGVQNADTGLITGELNVKIFLTADLSASEILSRKGAMETAISSADISGDSRYECLKDIHDYICNIADYDDTLQKENSHNAYGIFVDNTAVCEGYAKAFKMLCDQLEIPCVLVVGQGGKPSEQGAHMWNYVQMENGNWYAVDVTFDDQDSGILDTCLLVGADTVQEAFGEYTFADMHVEGPIEFVAGNENVVLEYPNLSAAEYVYEIVQDEIVYIPDENMKSAMIASGYDLNQDGNFSVSEMRQIVSLTMAGYGVTDLTGLEYAENLEYLFIMDNAITDLTPITGLTNLSTLIATNCQLENIPDLTALTKLRLYYEDTNEPVLMFAGNQISKSEFAGKFAAGPNEAWLEANSCDATIIEILDSVLKQYLLDEYDLIRDGKISLYEMQQVERITIYREEITSLQGLEYATNLKLVDFKNCELTDITPLGGLGIEELYLHGNNLKDITPLASCPNLHTLSVQCNDIQSIPDFSEVPLALYGDEEYSDPIAIFAGNPQLNERADFEGKFAEALTDEWISANICDNTIVNIPDEYLKEHLLWWYDRNGDSEMSVFEMEAITGLSIEGMGISSLEGLEYAKNLNELYAQNNEISDLTPLTEVSEKNYLHTVDLVNNSVSDITPIVNENTRILHLDYNLITDVSALKKSEQLRELTLNQNLNLDFQTLKGIDADLELYDEDKEPRVMFAHCGADKDTLENIFGYLAPGDDWYRANLTAPINGCIPGSEPDWWIGESSPDGKDYPGFATWDDDWLSDEQKEKVFHTDVRIYRDGEYLGEDCIYDYVSYMDLRHNFTASGSYTFDVSYDVGENYYSMRDGWSEMSAPFEYVEPEKKVSTPTNLRWTANGDMLWDSVPEEELCETKGGLSYKILKYYKDSDSGEYCYYGDYDTSDTNRSSLSDDELYEGDTWVFRVMALGDLETYGNSALSDFSEEFKVTHDVIVGDSIPCTDPVWWVGEDSPDGEDYPGFATWDTSVITEEEAEKIQYTRVKVYRDHEPVGSSRNTGYLKNIDLRQYFEEDGYYTFQATYLKSTESNARVVWSDYSYEYEYLAPPEQVTTPTGLQWLPDGRVSWDDVPEEEQSPSKSGNRYVLRIYSVDEGTVDEDWICFAPSSSNEKRLKEPWAKYLEVGKAYVFRVRAYGDLINYANSEWSDYSPEFVMTQEFIDGATQKQGWVEADAGWMYYRDGEPVCSEFVLSDGRWYYLGSDGIMVTSRWISFVNDDGVTCWRYLNGEGKAVAYDSFKLKTIHGKQYTFDSDGIMRTGWISSASNENAEWKEADHYFIPKYENGEDNGSAANGLIDIEVVDGNESVVYTFYFENYVKFVNGSFEVDGITYAADENGVVTVDGATEKQGWVETDSGWMYYRDGELVCNEFLRSDGRWYYLGDDGIMVTSQWVSFVNDDGVTCWRYLNGEGKAVAYDSFKLKTIHGKQYTFDSDGIMRTGWISSASNANADWKEANYYFIPVDENGKDDGSAANGLKDIEVVDGDKSVVYTFYFENYVKFVNGSFELDGITYAADENGVVTEKSADVSVVITKQPTDTPGANGDIVTFSAEAEADSEIHYQWYYSGNGGNSWLKLTDKENAYSGTTESALNVTVSTYRKGLLFRCVVSADGYESTTSDVVKITTAYIAILNHPTNQPGKNGETVCFEVEADGASSYQWYYSANDGETWLKVTDKENAYSGAATSALTVTVSTYRKGLLYRCEASADGCESATSNAVKITAATAIVTQPEDTAGVNGETVSFEVEAEGASGYQWYYSGNNGSRWLKLTDKENAYSGAATSVLTVTVSTYRRGLLYRCVVSGDGSDPIISDAVMITTANVAIVTQPKDTAGVNGETVSFEVEAEGASDYQWYYSGNGGSSWLKLTDKENAYSGAKEPVLTVTVSAYRKGLLFRCMVRADGCDPVASDAVRITTAGVTITKQPESTSGVSGETVSFEVEAEGDCSYQWYYSGNGGNSWLKLSDKENAYSGATESVLTVTVSTYRKGLLYRCMVSADGGSAVTSSVQIQ